MTTFRDWTMDQVAAHQAKVAAWKCWGESPAQPMAQPEIARPGGAGKATGSKPYGPNKTEDRFFRSHLEPLLKSRQLDCAVYEGLTFRLPGGKRRRYTPDWVAWDNNGRMYAYEVKGSYIHSRDSREKLMSARAFYEHVTFECWQYKDGIWNLIWE